MSKKTDKKSDKPMKKGSPLGSLEDFKRKMRKDVGLPENDRKNIVVEPTTMPVVPVVSEAVDGASISDIDTLIAKKKNRLFGKSEKLENLSIADLEILRAQKQREADVERHRLEDEKTLAAMRQDKREYYENLRQRYKMSESFEARLEAFFDKRRLPDIKMFLELYGFKIIDKKHVFTDAEFETFYQQWKEKGVRCPYDTFALNIKQQIVVRSPNDEHRKELWEKVIAEDDSR